MEDLLQEEVVKLEEELNKLKSAVEYIETAKISIEAASKIINTIIKLKEEFDKLAQRAIVLIDKLDKIDFPSRLDKIDSKVLAVSNDIHALETRIEASNKAFTLELKSGSKSMISEVGNTKNDIVFQLKQQSKEIKIVQYGIIGVFAFLVIIGALFYFNIL
jgi:cell division protein ZapA (FtsZ GTPase activity inhibitor)